ncbi:MAG: primosomal protein N' [Candidatus Aminicenantes bacterium]|jgi:primosomal protein N' (replication factor Y)
MKLYAEIVFPLPLDQSFLYAVPEVWAEKASVGARVLSSFHNRTLTGFIVGLKKRRPSTIRRLKDIIEVLDDEPVFSSSFLKFTRELSTYFYTSWGELLQAALPSSYVLKSKPKILITEKGKQAVGGKDLAPEDKTLLNLLLKGPYSERFVSRRTGLIQVPALLKRLEKKGLVRIERDIQKKSRRRNSLKTAPPTQLEMDFSLDAQLYQVVGEIFSGINQNVFSPFFLYGPREKREAVYFSLIQKSLALAKTTLFLVPEISLTQTLREKFLKRFGEGVALIHSQMTQKQKEIEWQRIKANDVRVVVGPRSAVLAPLENLGLVIVDEEQDESYYQKESPSYDARQGARIRAVQASAVLIFGSSAPSVEGFFRAKQQNYLIPLEAESPPYRVEFFEKKSNGGLVDPRVFRKIKERLEQKSQILVFFNRRGYAPYLICSRCSSIPRCVRCDIGLTYHKRAQKLICRYCNYSVDKFDRCPACGEKIIMGKSFGIEAVEEEFRKLFPQHRIEGFNLDEVRSKQERERVVKKFWTGKIDVLIGTQLLVHRRDIPPVLTAVSLFPEAGLSLSDFRASQRTFQSLSQMMSFLKDDIQSEFLIQTSFSPHYSIRYAAERDFLSFFDLEIKSRRIMKYPPFACMVEILFYGENLRTLAKISRDFLISVRTHTHRIEILGPALASVSRVRGRNRIQVILKSGKKRNLDRLLRACLPQIKTRKSVYVYE